jgi:hypothetical protein
MLIRVCGLAKEGSAVSYQFPIVIKKKFENKIVLRTGKLSSGQDKRAEHISEPNRRMTATPLIARTAQIKPHKGP